MLIKSVGKNGVPVQFAPSELVYDAIVYALRKKSDQNLVYWAEKKSLLSQDAVQVVTHPDTGLWDATARGEVMVGHTEAKTDAFHVPKKHSFYIHYKSAKDHLGLPDIQIVDFQIEPISNNPTDFAGGPSPLDEIAANNSAKNKSAK